MFWEGLKFSSGLIFLVTLSISEGRLVFFGDRSGVILGVRKWIENWAENLARGPCGFCKLGGGCPIDYRKYPCKDPKGIGDTHFVPQGHGGGYIIWC